MQKADLKKRRQFTKEDWQIYSFLIPASVLIVLFSYIPMYGLVMAFQNYRAGSNIFDLANAKWVGLKYINMLK